MSKGKKLPSRQLVEFTIVLRSSIKPLELSQAIMDAIPSSPICSTSKIFDLRPISEKTARRRCPIPIHRKAAVRFYELFLYSSENSTLGLNTDLSSNTPQPIKELLLLVLKQKWTVEGSLLSILKHEENKHEQNESWVKALRKSWEEDMGRKPEERTEVCEALASSAKKVQWTDEHYPNQAEADFLFGDGPIPPEFLPLRNLHGAMDEEDWLVFPRSWTWGDEKDWLVTDEQRLRMRRWQELRRQAKAQWDTKHNRSRQDLQYANPIRPHRRKK